VPSIDRLLKHLRKQWGLSLRDVAKRSRILADEWGNSAYGISLNCLWKLEHGAPHLTVQKLLTLSRVLSSPPEDLLYACIPPSLPIDVYRKFAPNRTLLAKRGGLIDEGARLMLLDKIPQAEIPDATSFLPPEERLERTSLRLVVIGKNDLALSPMIPPGSILKIDIRMKAILPPRDWRNEFDRPVYVLRTREDGLITGWCEEAGDGTLMLLTHHLSRQKARPFKHQWDVDIVGRAVAVAKPMVSDEERKGDSR
jgi:transcriptional regulator with XRE-family HTH domain